MGSGAEAKKWIVSAGVSSFASTLRFSGDRDFRVFEQSVAASLGRRFGKQWSVRVVGGAVLGGRLDRGGERFDVNPGWLAAINVAGNWMNVGGKNWFLGASLTVGASSAPTGGSSGESRRITAQDTRLGVLFGHVFAQIWSPYVLARAFGGPVKWTVDGGDATGTDTHHYALGLGGNITVTRGFDVFAEEAYFGERSLAAGASLAF